MKKVFTLILSVLMLIAFSCALVGCPSAPEKKPAEPAKKEAAAPAPAVAPVPAAAPAPAVMLKDINFDFDKFNLKPETREIIKQHADYLTKNADKNVTIEGHCDERGTAEYNIALGERRAKEAMKYLKGLGISEKRMKTVSYGKEKPLDPGQNEEARAKNRRVHFVVTP